jgi:2-polyprenyl-3-methyl-5-hydroxy-6-metoxy-1,4-benzoquinol methylase
MEFDSKKHWDDVYNAKPVHKLGWYEEEPEPSLRLLMNSGISKDDPIIDVGVGASTFIDSLIDHGYRDIIGVDISIEAISKLKERLGNGGASRVSLLVEDVTSPDRLQDVNNVAVWHDRAMLHFLTGEEQRQAYLSTLQETVRPGGQAIIAAYALTGTSKCSGLDIINYSPESLDELLGDEFELEEAFDHVHYMPSGEERPFIFTRFRKA